MQWEAQKQSEEIQKEENKKQEEQKKQGQKKEEINRKSVKEKYAEKNITPKTSKKPVPQNTEFKPKAENKQSETEVETQDGKKIKTKTEDDGTEKVEIEQGKLKVKYVIENGQVKLKLENEEGEEVSAEKENLNELEEEIEDGLEAEGIKIATGSGRPAIVRKNVAALTRFPLSINPQTNQLVVSTPAGEKIVTVLPDQAVQNLLSKNIVNVIEGSSSAEITPELGALEGTVSLEIKDNEVVYKVKGKKSHKLLGFFPIQTDTTAFVSAETGEPVAQEQSLLSRFIDIISI